MATTQANMTLQRVKGIMDVVSAASTSSITQYFNSNIFRIYSSVEDFEIYNELESGSAVKELTEYEVPPVLELDEGYQVTIRTIRYGVGILVPQKIYSVDKNDTSMKVQTYLAAQTEMAMVDLHNKIITEAFLMYNEAFDSDAKYLAPDGLSLANASHAWSSGDTFSNTSTSKLSMEAVDEAIEWGGNSKDPAGIVNPKNLDTIIVKKGSTNSRIARKLFAEGISPVAVGDINIYEGEFRIEETPYITYANRDYWFMIDSSVQNPLAVGINIAPTMNEAQVDSNEAIRTNLTAFMKFGITRMPAMVYCSNGTVAL